MNVITYVVLTFVACASAQNAPGVNWQNVVQIHQTPNFFENYPILRQIYNRQSPLTSSLEGTATTRNQFPYQVALVLNREGTLGFCGGSLISNQWILTSAHCLDGASNGTAFLGAHNVRNAAEGGQTRFVVNDFRFHPGWNGLRLTDDVGLVRLPTTVQFNANVAAVRLSNYRQVPSTYIQQQATVSGWGRSLFAPAVLTSTVRSANFRVISLLSCRLRTPDLEIEQSQICVEPLAVARQCPAEPGSPLVVIEADGSPTQIGVSSFVAGLGCSARPAIFIRLNFYLRWIQQTAGIVIANDFVF